MLFNIMLYVTSKTEGAQVFYSCVRYVECSIRVCFDLKSYQIVKFCVEIGYLKQEMLNCVVIVAYLVQ